MSKRFKKFWRFFGPGLITGASDDDPSGIATYTIAGAKFGPMILWTMPYLLPLMTAVQEMSAKIGITSSCGLAGNIKRYYSKKLLFFVAILIITASVFNIGANVSGMAASIELLFPGPTKIFSALITLIILYAVVALPYRKIVVIFKWLALSLLVYVVAGLTAITEWRSIFFQMILPKIQWSREYLVILVAVLGTTISPYLSFWQASEEAEEKRQESGNRTQVCKFRVVSKRELHHSRKETALGMFFSNFIAFFIIALAGSVLFRAGITNVESVKEAAEAIRPLAGNYTYAFFALGVLSSGALAIPVLAGSAAYVLAELFGWQASLDKPFSKAKEFYLVIIVSTILGLAITHVGLSPIKALFYTAILYGIISPILIGTILHMSNNPTIVGPNKNSLAINLLGYITLVLMSVGAIAFFVTI